MAVKEVKCQWCSEKSPKDQMDVYLRETNKADGTKGVQKVNLHKGICFDEYMNNMAFKAKEAVELDDLYETIKKLHRLDVLPSSFFSGYLQPLRNGVFKMGRKVKKYKEGIPYNLMKESYIHIENSIEWARTNRQFDGASNMLKYTFAIMVDKLPVVKKRQRQQEFAKEVADKFNNASQSAEEIKFMNRDIKFKKKGNGSTDISHYLD